MLLVGAGLLIKSFWRLQKVDPGFNPDNALTAWVSLPNTKYPEDSKVLFFQQLIERSGPAGVQAAGAANVVPMTGDDYVLSFQIDGRPPLLRR